MGMVITANFYDRPRKGRAFVGSFTTSGYKHRIITKGGFDNASFTLNIDPSRCEAAFKNLFGCVVRTFADNPAYPIFEGFVNRITWRTGSYVLTRSFDEMANRVQVAFYDADSGSVVKTKLTAVAENTKSIALWGAKSGTFDKEVHHDNADKTHPTMLRDSKLSRLAFPQVSIAPDAGGAGGIVEIELKGLSYYVWDWQTYDLPSGSAAATTLAAYRIFEILTIQTNWDLGQLLPLNASSVYLTGPNPTAALRAGTANRDVQVLSPFNISNIEYTGKTYFQALQSISEGGDGTAPLVFGISVPTLYDDEPERRVYLRAPNKAVKYLTSAFTDIGTIRDLYGRRIEPWLIRPDAGVRVNDLLTLWDEVGDKPNVSYISEVEYSADDDSVQWQSEDNITLYGTTGKNKRFKVLKSKTDDPFAAEPRKVL